MRYRLRTLLILLAVGPPLVGGAIGGVLWWRKPMVVNEIDPWTGETFRITKIRRTWPGSFEVEKRELRAPPRSPIDSN